MRRLPVYFLIDISESMVGEPIQRVEEGLADIIKALKTNPYALETVWISVLVFAGQAKTLVPLQEIISFYPPRFPIGSGTSLSKGLGHLMYELRTNVKKTTTVQKGDWKPLVFLFTDGVPTDDTQSVVQEWKQNWAAKANLVAISFGNETDIYLLSQLTENVLVFNSTNPTDYAKFFQWVTASIQSSSEGIDKGKSDFEMAELADGTLSRIDLTKNKPNLQKIDNNFAVLAARCQNIKRPYLMKYRRTIVPSSFSGLDYQTQVYRLVGAFPVEENYFELSEKNSQTFKINTDELMGAPTCPCCGNQFAFAMCACGKIHCIGEEEISTCPWCGNQGKYGFTSGGEGFDVNRTQG